jgi:hypothetical protein
VITATKNRTGCTLALPVDGKKEEVYIALVPQIGSVISSTDDLIANLANVGAILKQAFDFHWLDSIAQWSRKHWF